MYKVLGLDSIIVFYFYGNISNFRKPQTKFYYFIATLKY